MNNLKNILKYSLIIICFCLVTSMDVEAKTITNSNETISDTYLNLFDNIYSRSNYRSYMIIAEPINYGTYQTYNNYYFCLSNEKIQITNVINANLVCEEYYLYSRNESNDYILTKMNETSLQAVNSIYYSSDNKIDGNAIQFCCLLILGLFCITNILKDLFE